MIQLRGFEASFLRELVKSDEELRNITGPLLVGQRGTRVGQGSGNVMTHLPKVLSVNSYI